MTRFEMSIDFSDILWNTFEIVASFFLPALIVLVAMKVGLLLTRWLLLFGVSFLGLFFKDLLTLVWVREAVFEEKPWNQMLQATLFVGLTATLLYYVPIYEPGYTATFISACLGSLFWIGLVAHWWKTGKLKFLLKKEDSNH